MLFVLDHQHGRRDVTCKPRGPQFWKFIRTKERFYVKKGSTPIGLTDHFTFPCNCPPTPPLNQHFALGKN